MRRVGSLVDLISFFRTLSGPNECPTFSVAHKTVDDLGSLKGCSVLLHEFYDFELILGRIQDKTIVTFIGNEVYLDRIQQRLGDPHMKLETRIRQLEPIG